MLAHNTLRNFHLTASAIEFISIDGNNELLVMIALISIEESRVGLERFHLKLST